MNRIVAVLLVPYALWLAFAYDFHFIDWANLAFHETGHLVLTPFGQTLHFLGGTFGQLVFPIVLWRRFHREGKPFETAIAALWLFENLMYVAWYMADAQAMIHPLAGGGVHDWNWLLSQWGLLASCQPLASALHGAASLGAFAAVGFALRAAFNEAPREALSPELIDVRSAPLSQNRSTHGGDTYGAPPPSARSPGSR